MSTRLSELSATDSFSDDDLLLITDVDDTQQSPDGSSKSITCQALLSTVVASLTGDSSSGSVPQSASDQWDDAYTTVQSYSANWNKGYNIYGTVTAAQDDWNTAYTTITSNSGVWNATYNTVSANSGTWNIGDTAYSLITSNSAAWLTGGSESGDSANSRIESNSGAWANQYAFTFVSVTGTDQATLSAGSTTDTLTISAISGINVTTLSSTNTIVLEVTGAAGGGATSAISLSESANWDTTYTIVSSNSAAWNVAYSTVTANSGVWSTVNISESANWNTAYSTVTANSATWASSGGGSSGGSSGGSGGTSPGYTTVQATSAVVNSTTMNVATIPLSGSTDKFKVVEKNGDGTKWRLNLTGGTIGEYYTFRIAWDNIYPRGYGNNYEYYDDAVLPTSSYFDVGWDGDYTTPTMVLEKKQENFRPDNFAGPQVNITRVHVSRQPYKMTLQCNLDVASGSTVTTDSNGDKWLTNSGMYSSNGNGWLWYLAINGYPLDADPHSTPEGGIMRYIYAYDDGNGGPMLKYWDENFNMAEISTTSDLTVESTATYGSDTVVTEATWWDTDFIYMMMENSNNTDNIGSGGNYEGTNQFITNV